MSTDVKGDKNQIDKHKSKNVGSNIFSNIPERPQKHKSTYNVYNNIEAEPDQHKTPLVEV